MIPFRKPREQGAYEWGLLTPEQRREQDIGYIKRRLKESEMYARRAKEQYQQIQSSPSGAITGDALIHMNLVAGKALEMQEGQVSKYKQILSNLEFGQQEPFTLRRRALRESFGKVGFGR